MLVLGLIVALMMSAVGSKDATTWLLEKFWIPIGLALIAGRWPPCRGSRRRSWCARTSTAGLGRGDMIDVEAGAHAVRP